MIVSIIYQAFMFLGFFGCGYNLGNNKSPKDIINHLYSTVPLIIGLTIKFLI